MSRWFDEHCETFVRRKLGRIPNTDGDYMWRSTFSPRIVQTAIACWDRAKRLAAGRPLLLPGRDPYLFVILAGIEEYPVTFRPEISSVVAGYVKDDLTGHVCIDTGYRGSVPKALRIEHFWLVSYLAPGERQMPTYLRPSDMKKPAHRREQHLWYVETTKGRTPHQLFPFAPPGSPMNTLASSMEGIPKYWRQGNVTFGEHITITQTLADDYTFEKAFQVTRLLDEVFKHRERVRKPVRPCFPLSTVSSRLR